MPILASSAPSCQFDAEVAAQKALKPSTSDEAKGAEWASRLTGKTWFLKNSNLADYVEVCRRGTLLFDVGLGDY